MPVGVSIIMRGPRERCTPATLDRPMLDDAKIVHGELRDQLVAAMQRVPELDGRELTLTALSGGITNRNFLVAIHGERARYDIREQATIAGVADSLRRIHDGPPIPGLFVPLRIVEAYRALAMARGVRIPPEYELATAIGRRIELACLADPVELRPCHNDLLNANFIDDGERIRIVDWEYAGMGDPFFDLANFSINHEFGEMENEELLRSYFGERSEGDVSGLRLMRFMSDFREAMWGVVQQ